MTFSELRNEVMWIGNPGYVYYEESGDSKLEDCMRDAPAVPLKELASEAEQGNRVSEWMSPKKEIIPEQGIFSGLGAAIGGLSSQTATGLTSALMEQERRMRDEYEYRYRQMQQASYQNMYRSYP